MKLLPVALNLEGKRVLVVGGGAVAERKVRACLECGARVRVIAPELCEGLAAFADAEHFDHLARHYAVGDCAESALVFAATDQRAVNAQVQAEARELGVWCSVADDSQGSDLHGAATVQRGAITVGITTRGGSPALARHLKERVAQAIGPEYEILLELLAARRASEPRVGAQAELADRWRAVLKSEVLELLRAGRTGEAEQKLDEILSAVETARSVD